MKLGKAFLLTAIISVLCLSSAFAQIYNFTTIAGTAGTSGSSNGLGTVALFDFPSSVAVGGGSNVYVVDYQNGTIRKIVPLSGKWVVTTIAGTAGTTGSDDGTGTNALFYYPMGIAISDSGTLYVADYGNSTIRAIVPVSGSWVTTTIAGTAGTTGSDDGVASDALFYTPTAVAVDTNGNIYVADHGNHTIRQITLVDSSWIATTIAGKAGRSGSVDGTNSTAHFNGPSGVAVDTDGNVYVSDYGNNTIRKITPVGTNWVVTTIAGTAGKSGTTDGTNGVARFYEPMQLAVDASGNLFVADAGNDTIRRITPSGTNWVVKTVGGRAGKSGHTDGSSSSARFRTPMGIATDSSGNLYIADTDNDTIRRGLALAETFVSLQGTYNGLAMRTNAVSQAGNGSLKLVLTETGSFTATLNMGGTKLAFIGQFDESGNATNTVSSSWQVALHLDVTGDTDEITGSVSHGGSESELLADLATFGKANACPLAGTYTIALEPPSYTDSTLPKGWGFATGVGKLSGTLGDGTKFNSPVPISKYGTAPLYGLLYGNKGSCAGWLTFTNDTIEATVNWIRPSATKGYYTSGFATNVALIGSTFVAPAAGEFLINLTNSAANAMLVFGGGNLAAWSTNSLTVTTNNIVTVVSGNTTNLTLKLVPKTGLFSGRFLHPATHKTVKFQGAVLQSQDAGAGCFAGTNETGFAVITPTD